ncbi:uncharacterized protein LOC123683000 [Harmonia axyridis]|uniref:uncharacterized protein LOC123683000 n=1 Tax=Harmonia axyridis TaxID=115357 RepID=UPI001E278D0C|nr:uncharacterized protein LOC123683000 [Harmonia axyridis]
MGDETIIANFKSLVAQMLKEKNIENYNIDIKGNSGIGDGYMGDIIFFKVTMEKDSSVLSLVMKLAKNNKALRDNSNLEENFRREIFMYETVFRSIESYFAKLKPNVKVLDYIPKLFWSNPEQGKEALVLENLKADGFTSWEKFKPLDFEHTKQVCRNLAKWHGEVMAFRDQNPDQFESWIPKLENIRYELLVQIGLIKHAYKNYRKVVEMFEERGQHELAVKFKAQEKNLEDFCKIAEKESDRLVITHADLWINNVLFKFPTNGNIASENKYFDFQVSNVNTPVEDLSFFIYGHCDKDVLDKLDLVLQDYYATLSETVKKLGSDPEKIFSYEDLEEHWRKYGMSGVISALEIIKLQLIHEDEIETASEITEGGEVKLVEPYNFVIRNEDLYFERLISLFTHFGNKYF